MHSNGDPICISISDVEASDLDATLAEAARMQARRDNLIRLDRVLVASGEFAAGEDVSSGERLCAYLRSLGAGFACHEWVMTRDQACFESGRAFVPFIAGCSLHESTIVAIDNNQSAWANTCWEWDLMRRLRLGCDPQGPRWKAQVSPFSFSSEM